jgi:transcriptional regulator with XRE-family HTH domain
VIERQENSPTVEVLERIAKALGIEPARLFDDKEAGRNVQYSWRVWLLARSPRGF